MSKQAAFTFARTQISGGEDDASGEPLRLKGDGTTGSLRVNLWVWDTDTLGWVKMTQPIASSSDLASTMSDLEKALVSNYWKDQRFDYTSGSLDYKGMNTTHKADTTATTWYIQKFTWAGDNIVRIEGPLVGSWDGRAALAWA